MRYTVFKRRSVHYVLFTIKFYIMKTISYFFQKIIVRIFLQRLSAFYSPLKFFKVHL